MVLRVESHRLTVYASKPGIGATWVGYCSCGLQLTPRGHRLEVEREHAEHVEKHAERPASVDPAD
jgi:hypothetical protein